MSEAVTTVAARSSSAAGSRHAVQFFGSDQFLARSVGAYVRAALHGGGHVLLVAEADHWQAVSRDLSTHGVDVDSMHGRVGWAEVHETLARVMAGSMPAPALFKSTIDSLTLSHLGNPDGKPLQVYGEMVNVLLREGNTEGALSLEDLWNRHLSLHPLSLLCGYSIASFDERADLLEQVCGCHGRVIPAEDYTRIENDERRQWEVVSLQLRARALAAEVRRRVQLELTLREALAERERALERERAARGEAEAANRAKDEFLAVLSHELRTPLNAILGWAHLLGDPGAEQSKVAAGLDAIRRNAMVQARLIDDLLDVGRILAGNLRIRAEPVDLAEVVRAAIATIRPAADAKGIQLDLRIVGTIAHVNGDTTQLQHAVWHLLSNAVKFTPERGRVDVWLGQDGPRARLIVRDSGQGIKPEFLPYVFDRFRQAEAGLARRHGGLGLGLAIVRHVVEAHGGTAWVSSAGEGLGATFGVDLPVAAAA